MYQKLVIVKSRTTGKIGQYLLTLVPDIEYERQHQGEVADLFINAGDKGGFSGVAIPMSQAQYWANQGYFVVAGWINPSGESGHVVVVVPGEGLQHSGWGGKIPHVMDTGAGKRTVGKTINYSFGKGKISSIKYYVYK